MKKLLIIFAMMIASVSHAAIVFVTPNGSGDYITVVSAYVAAAAGDTILIGPGTYNESITSIARETHFIGAGFDVTEITRLQFGTTGHRSTIEGLRFNNGTSNLPLSFNSADSISIKRCYFLNSSVWSHLTCPTNARLYAEDCLFIRNSLTGGGTNISLSTGGSLYLRNCVFAIHFPQNGYNALAGTCANVEMHNCTLLGYREVFNMTTTNPAIFINNLFHDWASSPSWGNHHPGSIWDYNGSTSLIPPGTHALLLAANPFVNYVDSVNFVYGTTDLHLAGGSAAINAGHPDILDLDASVSDLGAYGGPTPLVDTGAPPYPFTISVATDPATAVVGTDINLNSVGRIGPQY
ncbi:MAG: hypothetical protein H6505_02130 [Calditrichaeota bacterium]|nr:hypothetical protein [Calditrichota bacterium]